MIYTNWRNRLVFIVRTPFIAPILLASFKLRKFVDLWIWLALDLSKKFNRDGAELERRAHFSAATKIEDGAREFIIVIPRRKSRKSYFSSLKELVRESLNLRGRDMSVEALGRSFVVSFTAGKGDGS